MSPHLRTLHYRGLPHDAARFTTPHSSCRLTASFFFEIENVVKRGA